MLYHDCHYLIGKSHLYCEDYACRGTVPTPWVLVSDGCSGSPDTDLGARLLARLTQRYLENPALSAWPDYTELGLAISSEAAQLARQLALAPGTLDATLLLAGVVGDEVWVYVYGDGYVLLKDRQGQVQVIEFSFTHNAPFYLSYWPDAQRRARYAALDETPATLCYHDGRNGERGSLAFDTPLLYRFALAEYPVIGIASDGLGAFVTHNRQQRVPATEIAARLLDFRHAGDNFVRRRVPKELQRLSQADCLPMDDVSLGVFYRTD